MSSRTRLFVITSLLVLVVGVGAGLVAYYAGVQPGGASRAGLAELEFLPADATLVAYADVREVMASELREHIRLVLPAGGEGQRELQEQTGINIETDIDRVVACITPASAASGLPGAGLVLARGRFDEVKIEALMRSHGASIEDYQGHRLVVAGPPASGSSAAPPAVLALSFLEPGLVALGSPELVRGAIGLKRGGAGVTSNAELMERITSLGAGHAWAVGRFDALASQAGVAGDLVAQLPPITWFSVSGFIDGGIRGVLRAETRDAESANALRDVVRGLVALAKLQASSNPGMKTLIDSLELGGTDDTVALAFEIPAALFDLLDQAAAR